MTFEEIKSLATACYAAFNANPPRETACRIWAEQCVHVPFDASFWIRDQLINRENLPRQFGRAVLDLYADWRSERGIKAERRAPCPNCDLEMPGFFFAWMRVENQVYKLTFRCACNQDKVWSHIECIHKREAKRRGYAVMPEGYKLGSGVFEAQLLGYKKGDFDKAKLLQTLRNAQTEKVRPDHKRQLQENELW